MASSGITGTRTVVRFDELQEAVTHATNRSELFASAAFRDRFLAVLSDAHREEPISLLSLDVFDTLVSRRPISEIRRFLDAAKGLSTRLQRDLRRPFDPLEVLVCRIESTRDAYRLSEPVMGCREGRFSEIARGMARRLRLPEGYERHVWAAERAVELKNLTPNPLMHALASWAAERSIPLVALSDMYLEAERIADLVGEVDPRVAATIQAWYSSADTRVSKASGLAFGNVASLHRVAGRSLLHLGDNLRTDYRSAIRAGHRALLLPLPSAHEAEVANDKQITMRKLLEELPFVERLVG